MGAFGVKKLHVFFDSIEVTKEFFFFYFIEIQKEVLYQTSIEKLSNIFSCYSVILGVSMYFSAVLGAMTRAEAVWRKVWVSNWDGRSDQNFCLLKVWASAGA